MQTIAEKIKKAREAKGFKQEALASAMAILLKKTYSVRQYQRLEGGEFPKFKTDVVKALDTVLDTNFHDIIYASRGNNSEANTGKTIHSFSSEAQKELSDHTIKLLRIEAHLEVYESAIAGLLSKDNKEFTKRVGELRAAVREAFDRRYDEFVKKRG